MGKEQGKRKHIRAGYGRFLISALLLLMLSGCGRIKRDQDPDEDKGYQGISVSNDTVKPDGKILLNNAGYELEGSKIAMLTGAFDEETFTVTDADSGEEVFIGSIRYRNETGTCDFSDITAEGSYYITTDSGIRSDDLVISRDIYRQILAGRISRFGEDEPDKKADKDNFSTCCLRITDRLLTQEFFPSAIDGEAVDDPMVIPRTVLLAKSDIEELKKTRLSSDPGMSYKYSAVMALFSYEYERFDRAYAAECREMSAQAYDKAEKGYEKGSPKDKKAADDKRYWASAQLYKLTGEKKYRTVAEDYASDPPKGFNREKTGYLGTIAYLTCYKGIDLNVGELLITSIMDDINDAVRESFKDDFLAEAGDEPDDKQIETIYENARLMVLGNYISKNIRYVNGGENQVAYLYGRNMLGKDYAFEEDSEYYYEPMEFILAGLIDSYIYEDKKPEAMKKQ